MVTLAKFLNFAKVLITKQLYKDKSSNYCCLTYNNLTIEPFNNLTIEFIMKKLLLTFQLFLLVFAVQAQKFAYVDTEYILQNIPNYETAQQQLDDMSKKWQTEIEEVYASVEKMYKTYQAEEVLLTDEQKRKSQEEIINKENEAKALQKKYFARDGMLFNKRQELVKPIQDEVFNAVKEIAEEGSYAFIFDVSGSVSILYSNPKYDLSDLVLEKLGYKN